MLHRVRFRKDLQIFAADNPSTLSDHTKLRPPFGTLQHIPSSGSSKFWRRKGRKSLGLDLPFVFHILSCVSTIFLTPSETKKKSPAIPSHSKKRKEMYSYPIMLLFFRLHNGSFQGDVGSHFPQVAIEALHLFRGKAGADHASCSCAALLRNLSEGRRFLKPRGWFPPVVSTGPSVFF